MSAEKSVLIFGVAGFVGGYLSKEVFLHGYTVYGSDTKPLFESKYIARYLPCDLTDRRIVGEVCAELQPAYIVNLAAISSVSQSWNMPHAVMQVNVCGTLNIFEVAKELATKPKILIVGSSEEYAASNLPLKETDAIDAANPYGISKMAQERFAEVYEERYGLKIFRTRSFNHTGVGQSPSFVLSSWCKQVAELEASQRSGYLRVGNVDVYRDFSDVRDVVRAYRLLIESSFSGEVFNIGSGRSLKLEDLARSICSLSSRDIDICIDNDLLRPIDVPYICCDRTKAESLLRWIPRIDIEDTLKTMYENYMHAELDAK